MKLNKKKKRVLISIPITFVVITGLFTLFIWMMGGGRESVYGAFRSGVAAGIGGCFFWLLSLLFNWPEDLRDNK